jgi:hypothetical protein
VGRDQADTPAGLRIVDTRSWTERTGASKQTASYFFAHRHHAQLRDPATGATLRSFAQSENLFTLFSD